MPAFTREVALVLKSDDVKKGTTFRQWYNMDDLEQQFGGNMPNIQAPFFPPEMAGTGHTMLSVAEVN